PRQFLQPDEPRKPAPPAFCFGSAGTDRSLRRQRDPALHQRPCHLQSLTRVGDRGVPATAFPAIVKKSEVSISPWVRLVTKEVQMLEGMEPDTYHSIAQADYVAIFARTRDGRIPIVRQFRPAVEALTWELPAGMVDAGESASETCRRELYEETGLQATSIRF